MITTELFSTEKCRNELVLHETAQVLRQYLQLHWDDISAAEIDAVCEKLVAFVFHSPELSYGIHRSLSTVVALIVKRDRVLREGKKCVELVQFLESLMHGSTLVSLVYSACTVCQYHLTCRR